MPINSGASRRYTQKTTYATAGTSLVADILFTFILLGLRHATFSGRGSSPKMSPKAVDVEPIPKKRRTTGTAKAGAILNRASSSAAGAAPALVLPALPPPSADTITWPVIGMPALPPPSADTITWPVIGMPLPRAPLKRPAAWVPGTGRGKLRGSAYSTEYNWPDEQKKVSSQKLFRESIKKWAATLIPKQTISTHAEPHALVGHYKYVVWCTSCVACNKKGRGWGFTATYKLETGETKIRARHISAHGKFDLEKGKNKLTASARAAALSFAARNPQAKGSSVGASVRKLQPRPVHERKFAILLRNAKRRGLVTRRWTKLSWLTCDWRRLTRQSPSFESAEARKSNQLCVVAQTFDAVHTTTVFCSPLLVKEVLDRIANKEYVKLCGDGTFRLIRDGWVLMTLGVLSKHHAQGEADNHACFRTSYLPWLFAVTSQECAESYDFFFQHALCVANTCCPGFVLESACRQYHGDWHKGEEKARAARFPKSLRAADWAHFVGATTSTKKNPHIDDEYVLTWRSGVYHTLQKHHVSTEAMDLIRTWLPILRKTPTAAIFHTLTHYLFEALGRDGQETALKVLRTYYFAELSGQDATNRFGIRSWIGGRDSIWYAYWWAGFQRLQPGSASGSQSQEAWHKKFKGHIGNLNLEMPDFYERLDSYCQWFLEQLQLTTSPFPDLPTDPYPDSLLLDADRMDALERTSAPEFLQPQCMAVWCDGKGTEYYAMRPHLRCWNVAKEVWEKTSTPRTSETTAAQHMASLLTADTASSMDKALRNLGAGRVIGASMESLRVSVTRYYMLFVGGLFWFPG
jgi:hypothetical protein